jgi:hypothetical protein
MKELQDLFMLWRRKAYRARQSEARRDSQAKPGIVSGECAEALWGNKMFSQLNRLVGLIDELESQGLVERRAHETDRRSRALHLTEKEKATMGSLGRIAREHRQDLLAALSGEEQNKLAALLERVAEQQGLLKGDIQDSLRLPGEENDGGSFRYPTSREPSVRDYRPLLQDARIVFRRGRRYAGGDDPRLEGARSIRWARFRQKLAVSHRHERLPGRDSQQGPPGSPDRRRSTVFGHAIGGRPGAASPERVD